MTDDLKKLLLAANQYGPPRFDIPTQDPVKLKAYDCITKLEAIVEAAAEYRSAERSHAQSGDLHLRVLSRREHLDKLLMEFWND